LLSENAVVNPPATPRKTKRSLLPILTVLFVVSYSLMVMLVVEQGSTITSQSWLIKQLFVDSTELTALKGKAVQKHNAELQAKSQASTQAQDQTKTKSQAPSPQVPAQNSVKERPAGQVRRTAPQHPPKPASDAMDARRALYSI